LRGLLRRVSLGGRSSTGNSPLGSINLPMATSRCLVRWRTGESSEWVPRPTARTPVPPTGRFSLNGLVHRMRPAALGAGTSRPWCSPQRLTAGHAARSLRSRPYAGDGLGLRSIEPEDGFGSRPSAGPAAREELSAMTQDNPAGQVSGRRALATCRLSSVPAVEAYKEVLRPHDLHPLPSGRIEEVSVT
jgi:hypothetical protein